MIIACINQKGGCGKSTTSFHLGGCLAERGYRTLLVDADPQGSLGQAFFGSQFVESLPKCETLAAIFNGLPGDSIVKSTQFTGLSIVCSNFLLSAHNYPNPHKFGAEQLALQSLLKPLRNSFDYILIDCPPNLHQCSWNALLAADEVLIPTPPEDFGVQGLRAVRLAVENAQTLNRRLRRLRFLISRICRRYVVHQMYEQMLRELYEDEVLECVIPEAVAFKSALTFRTPVTFNEPNSAASISIHSLANELGALGAQASVAV